MLPKLLITASETKQKMGIVDQEFRVQVNVAPLGAAFRCFSDLPQWYGLCSPTS